ncbi:MAG: tail fiber domain-containing protein [Candidatus Omnitrophica bacterium]|nr:tail fiber domain-containing protein [Candidatus Omnitrophota bacterium]
MTKLSKIVVATLIIAAVPLAAAAETLTMTTYYPSPFGVYQSLRLAPNASPPACSGTTVGTIYVDGSNEMQYCDGTSYSQGFGLWRINGNNVYPVNWSTAEIGIGTSTPSERLTISGDEADYTAIRISNTTSTDSNWEIRAHDDNPSNGFSIWGGQAGSEAGRIFITGSGNVGIGTTAPTQDLSVVGDIDLSDDFFFSGGNPRIRITGGDFSIEPDAGLDTHVDLDSGSEFYIYDAFNSSHLFTVLQNTRRIGVLNAAPTSEFDVNGTVTAVAYLYSSDARLKTELEPVDGLSGILRLQGVHFKWKDDGRPDIGVTAQDVEAVYPELVHTDEVSGKKYVKYGNLIAPLIEAVKEQQALIEEQNKKIERLTDELEAIKQQLPPAGL